MTIIDELTQLLKTDAGKKHMNIPLEYDFTTISGSLEGADEGFELMTEEGSDMFLYTFRYKLDTYPGAEFVVRKRLG